MRILFLTNYYPPHEIGGQGRSCLDVVQGLEERGHICRVLTSMHGTANRPERGGGVYRELYLEMDSRPLQHMFTFFTRRRARETHNLAVLDRTIADFQPDVIFIWGMWNLPVSLPKLAEERLPGRTAYRFAEYWPTLPSQHELYWRGEPRHPLTYLPKKILGWIALRMLAREPRKLDLDYPHVMCVSAGTRQALVDAGIPVGHARVIHTGLDTAPFAGPRKLPVDADEPLRLLYVGRLAAEKGIDSVIRALAALNPAPDGGSMHLTAAGQGKPGYVEQLKTLAEELGVEDRVHFLGRLPFEQIPGLMAAHQVLVVPSVWPEPFARVVLEGMAAGMVVVGTPTGGTAEIVRDGENGLLFEPGDAVGLAERLQTLARSPEMCARLAQTGQETILEGYTRAIMLERIEQFLEGAARSGGAARQ